MTTTTIKPDAVLQAAQDLAREAAIAEGAAAAVGAHLEMVMEDERIASHYFECTSPGYVGWRWSVTVVRVPRAKVATIDEVVLLPGPDALVAPRWIPWDERVRPGDLGVGDLLPTAAGDARLIAGYTDTDDLEGLAGLSPLQPSQWEIGLGRARVLSVYGRDEAAERWSALRGGDAPIAKLAPAACSSCGFLITIGGVLGQAFGLCANEMSPADGQAVALDHGCGAHSEVVVEATEMEIVVVYSGDTDQSDLGHS